MIKRLESEILLSQAKMNAQEITEEENRDDFLLKSRSSAYNFERQSSRNGTYSN